MNEADKRMEDWLRPKHEAEMERAKKLVTVDREKLREALERGPTKYESNCYWPGCGRVYINGAEPCEEPHSNGCPLEEKQWLVRYHT